MQRRYDESVKAGEKGIALNPNGDLNMVLLGITLNLVRRYEEAIPLFKEAQRRHPHCPAWYIHNLGHSYRGLGRWDEAIAEYKRSLENDPNHFSALVAMAQAYGLAGRLEEGRVVAAEILKRDPKFTADSVARNYKYKSDTELYKAALIKVGIPEHPPLPLPDKPSIAVLPFENLNRDPEQDYFVDGMTDTLITDLSKISGLFVIARNSVFTYKGKPMKVKQISRDLGVRYVLEGSVQKAGNQVRINTNLIDAKTGGHLWAERYDGKMDDVFALQDKITQKIVKALAVQLKTGEQQQVVKKETDNLAAYDAFLKGWGHYLRHTPEDYVKALSHFEKATELDPEYGRAYASMALIYSRVSKLGRNWRDALYLRDSQVAERQAKKYLETAMRNPTSTAYRASSFINVYDRHYKAAIADAERALSLDPNDPGSHQTMAFVFIMAGRSGEAFDFAKKAMRLDPLNLANPLYCVGLAHFCLKEFEEAANSLERALTYSPGHTAYLMALAAAYGHLRREKEAEATLELIVKTFTGLDAKLQKEYRLGLEEVWEQRLVGSNYRYPPFMEHEMTDLFEGGLAKAGLKEIANFRAALTNY
jgi:TolB-like protein/Flp pilus assembly protein TadD